MRLLVRGSRTVFDVCAVLGREEAGDVGLRGPLDEGDLSEDGIAADAGDYYVDV